MHWDLTDPKTNNAEAVVVKRETLLKQLDLNRSRVCCKIVGQDPVAHFEVASGLGNSAQEKSPGRLRGAAERKLACRKL
jgi:uracil DNA glycosylase